MIILLTPAWRYIVQYKYIVTAVPVLLLCWRQPYREYKAWHRPPAQATGIITPNMSPFLYYTYVCHMQSEPHRCVRAIHILHDGP